MTGGCFLCWERRQARFHPPSVVGRVKRVPGVGSAWLVRGCRLRGGTVAHAPMFFRVVAKGIRWFCTKPSSVLLSPSFLHREPAGQLTMLSGNAGTERSD